MNGLLNDVTSQLLTKALNVGAIRQRVISNNIANINTPGFKRSFVTFEDQLQEALARTEGFANKQVGVKPEIIQDESSSMRQDGNNVDMDKEMANLAMNSINYSTAARQLNKKFAMLRYVITEGRG
ncbi:flagellar basal body rod protein FlgB [Metallumcola ferriviriculae]|uniref:Flagellar basal body rod protein FlgB n=1 Tax=Metallumcola ferriviriculae TaxID=3039180 RepID=A0AAU0UR88_9FIRM|nr:flagellar basal body rod protein FlgB [Desulfitibacteraceae bacterium MK1]